MKKISTLLGVVVVMFLAGCGKHYPTEISFASYHFTFNSSRTEYQHLSASNIMNQLASVIDAYTPQLQTSTGFKPSLIIAKLSVGSWVTTEQFVQKNIAGEKNKINVLSSPSVSNKTFGCRNQDRDASLVFTKIAGDREKQEYYLSQYFFVDQGYGYVISFLTDDNAERKDFASSLSTLGCPL